LANGLRTVFSGSQSPSIPAEACEQRPAGETIGGPISMAKIFAVPALAWNNPKKRPIKSSEHCANLHGYAMQFKNLPVQLVTWWRRKK
jgi:hypothetical protein